MPNSVQPVVAPSSDPGPDTASLGDASGTSVDRVLQLLQLMGEHQVLRVAEAAELLGVARSTAHRLLTALRRRGFVLQDRPNGAYRSGPALYEIALAAVNRIDIRQVARPVLEELRAETEETVSLAVLEGAAVRFIDCAESQRIVRVGNRTGVVRPAHASAVGKAILAGLSEAELNRRYPDGELPSRTTAATIADLAVLREELAEIRARGYALSWQESTDGVCAVAVALRDTVGQPLAGLGVVAPTSRAATLEGIRAFAPALVRGAALIEERLREHV